MASGPQWGASLNSAVSSSHVISTEYLHQIILTNCDDDNSDEDYDEDVQPSQLNYNLFPHICFLKHMHQFMFKLQNIVAMVILLLVHAQSISCPSRETLSLWFFILCCLRP